MSGTSPSQFVEAQFARAKHRARRELAYVATSMALVARYPEMRGLAFGAITRGAIRAWQSEWVGHPNRLVRWDWEWFSHVYRKRYDRFETALWCGQILCGLCFGRFSPARTVLSLNFVEGSPEPHHPLRGRVVLVLTELADVLASAYGSAVVRITDPSARMQRRAAALGFKFVAHQHGIPYSFCERGVP